MADEKNGNSFEENVDNCLNLSSQPEIEVHLENGSLDGGNQTATMDLQTSDDVINGNSETDTSLVSVSNNDVQNQDDQVDHNLPGL